ncbi:MAG: ABC transporter ATP-binding protein [Clostridium sp.]|nr:ABC transporter ATP-binding protein [Clostridium sp.]
MSFIKLENIKKVYGKDDARVEAIKNINLCIEKGEMVAIMGPSGSGKSTLLNILGFLDKPSEGKYIFEDKSTESLKDKELAKYRNNKIGFVVQNFALIEDYTVYQNISVPLEYAGIKKIERKERINRLLSKLNLIEKSKKIPSELSGGQNQRVAIARALVNDPEVILADEPTGALDRNTGKEVINIFRELNKEGKTIIIITHDEKIGEMCDRIIYIEDGINKER